MSLDRPVSDLMQREVVTLQEADHLDLADDIMRLGRIRHLPVLEGERLVGMLSSRDLLAASLSRAIDFEPVQRRSFMRAVEVKEVMTRRVESVAPGESAREAGRRMLERRIGCLPVVDEHGAFVGLLTETDLLAAVIGVEAQPEVVDVEGVEERMTEEGGQGRDTERFAQEFEELRRLRDELRVQVHLGRSEVADLWEKLEHRFREAEGRVRAFAHQAEEPVHEVAEAARLLLDEIRSGYRRLRDLL